MSNLLNIKRFCLQYLCEALRIIRRIQRDIIISEHRSSYKMPVILSDVVLYCIVVGSRRLMPPDTLQPKAYLQTLVFSLSYLHRQVSPPETLVVKGGTTWARNGRWSLPENVRLPCNIQGSFTCLKFTTWDRRLYFPSEERLLRDFFLP